MASTPKLIFRETGKDQPAIDLPKEFGHVIVDLTNPNESVAGLTYGDKTVTTGVATKSQQLVVAEVDTETGNRTGRVALAPIPQITDEVQ